MGRRKSDPSRSRIGRRSVRKGKDFERLIARRLNETLGTRYRRNRLGRTQPLGDLIPDEKLPRVIGGVGAFFEEHVHIECKSNVEFSWASLLAGDHTMLDEMFHGTKATAWMHGVETGTADRRPLLIFRHRGRIYAMISKRDWPTFRRARRARGPELSLASTIILSFELFLAAVQAKPPRSSDG